MIRERQAGQDRLDQPELELQRAALARARRTPTSPPSASRTPTGSAGCWAAPTRPFDPRVYFEFRIFKDFSGGITDQWYSHGSGLAHFYLDTFIPDDTVANGGIFAWHDVRENPDTFQCLSTFAEQAGALQLQHHLRQRATAITPSSAAPRARSTRPAARAARSGGSSPETRSGWRIERGLRPALGSGQSRSR